MKGTIKVPTPLKNSTLQTSEGAVIIRTLPAGLEVDILGTENGHYRLSDGFVSLYHVELVNEGPFMTVGGQRLYLNQPIIQGGSFTWGEATKNGTRVPTPEIADNIRRLARELQPIRNAIGRPMHVTSWYRPPAVNAAVGGASRSWHLKGLAVDVKVQGMTPQAFQEWVIPRWNGGVGEHHKFTHLDLGKDREFDY